MPAESVRLEAAGMALLLPRAKVPAWICVPPVKLFVPESCRMPLPVFTSDWLLAEPSAMFARMLRSALPCPRATENVWLADERTAACQVQGAAGDRAAVADARIGHARGVSAQGQGGGRAGVLHRAVVERDAGHGLGLAAKIERRGVGDDQRRRGGNRAGDRCFQRARVDGRRAAVTVARDAEHERAEARFRQPRAAAQRRGDGELVAGGVGAEDIFARGADARSAADRGRAAAGLEDAAGREGERLALWPA